MALDSLTQLLGGGGVRASFPVLPASWASFPGLVLDLVTSQHLSGVRVPHGVPHQLPGGSAGLNYPQKAGLKI